MLVQPGNGVPVILSSILESGDYVGTKEIAFRSCGTDPFEKLRKGLFVCLSENAAEAEEMIEQALISGATSIVVRRGLLGSFQLFREQDFIFEADKPELVYGRACQALMGTPAEKLKLIAVTGTSGKTALSYIIASVLAESGNTVGFAGSLGVYDGVGIIPNSDPSPDAAKLALYLAKMVKNKCTHAIIEVSSLALEKGVLEGIQFDAVCLTNIRRDHLDIHGTVELYRRAKMRIFDYIKPESVVVCNVDDRVTEAILPLIKSPVMTVGMHPSDAMVNGMPIEQDKTSQTFYIVAGIDAVPVRTRIIGTEHIYNCMIAAALGISWNIDLRTIVRGLERVEHIPCRLERIDCGQPFAVFVDCASTPDSIASSLNTLRGVSSGRIFCLFGIPGDNETSKRPMIGKELENLADTVILAPGNIKTTGAESRMNDVLAGFEDKDGVKIFSNRREAMIWLLTEASPDDTVLIISASHSSEVKTRKEQAADRQFVRHWLYENQPCMEPFWF
ncbi:MAG: UDP-N-acetylmuramyl-tripeptide synthetase [Planctomycetia bacterium]|nr:UDP-N-acetylmuramyl-tripeptide synthetase [Planctomycetia bacterium]